MNRTSYEFDVLVDPTKDTTKIDTAATTSTATVKEVEYFNLTNVKITKTGVYDMSIEVDSPNRAEIYYMITYTSLFDCTPQDIVNRKAYNEFTPYQYGNSSTKTYKILFESVYRNKATFTIDRLDSYTTFMVLITAKNQFG